jgi:hypothetical protein
LRGKRPISNIDLTLDPERSAPKGATLALCRQPPLPPASEADPPDSALAPAVPPVELAVPPVELAVPVQTSVELGEPWSLFSVTLVPLNAATQTLFPRSGSIKTAL